MAPTCIAARKTVITLLKQLVCVERATAHVPRSSQCFGWILRARTKVSVVLAKRLRIIGALV
jgi:hypothetical protein